MSIREELQPWTVIFFPATCWYMPFQIFWIILSPLRRHGWRIILSALALWRYYITESFQVFFIEGHGGLDICLPGNAVSLLSVSIIIICYWLQLAVDLWSRWVPTLVLWGKNTIFCRQVKQSNASKNMPIWS